MDLRLDPIPECWDHMDVEIEVSKKRIAVSSSYGEVAIVDPDYFEDEPREAIAMASLIAAAPALMKYVRNKAATGCDEARKILSDNFDAKP
jgi:hypothetical protein